jgi:tRNA(Phe) wybutosine-synthesizing methylase Tyw3
MNFLGTRSSFIARTAGGKSSAINGKSSQRRIITTAGNTDINDLLSSHPNLFEENEKLSVAVLSH